MMSGLDGTTPKAPSPTFAQESSRARTSTLSKYTHACKRSGWDTRRTGERYLYLSVSKVHIMGPMRQLLAAYEPVRRGNEGMDMWGLQGTPPGEVDVGCMYLVL